MQRRWVKITSLPILFYLMNILLILLSFFVLQRDIPRKTSMPAARPSKRPVDFSESEKEESEYETEGEEEKVEHEYEEEGHEQDEEEETYEESEEEAEVRK